LQRLGVGLLAADALEFGREFIPRIKAGAAAIDARAS
jgi:hypothetical protein